MKIFVSVNSYGIKIINTVPETPEEMEEIGYLFYDWNIEEISDEYNKLGNDWIQQQINEFKSGKSGKDIKNNCKQIYEFCKHEYRNTKSSYVRKDTKLININSNCSSWLGVSVAENEVALFVLKELYDETQKMLNGNKGYDWLCNKSIKIDVKSSCLEGNVTWRFGIDLNKIADYFLLIAFDNRKSLDILHMWLIRSNETIRGRKLNEFTGLGIYKYDEKVKEFERYRLPEEMICNAKETCKKFKNSSSEFLSRRH